MIRKLTPENFVCRKGFDPGRAHNLFDHMQRHGGITAARSVQMRLASRINIALAALVLAFLSAPLNALAQSRGVFTPTGNMTTPRASHTATLLPDGRVLILGGVPKGLQPEVYDPSTGTFSPADDMITSRDGHLAILLPDGNVIILYGGIVLQDGRRLILSPGNA